MEQLGRRDPRPPHSRTRRTSLVEFKEAGRPGTWMSLSAGKPDVSESRLLAIALALFAPGAGGVESL